MVAEIPQTDSEGFDHVRLIEGLAERDGNPDRLMDFGVGQKGMPVPTFNGKERRLLNRIGKLRRINRIFRILEEGGLRG